MSVHHVRPPGRSAELTNVSRDGRVQGPLVGSLEQSAQASLPRTPSPNLGHSPRGSEHRIFPSAGHLDESGNRPVAAVECDHCASVEYESHSRRPLCLLRRRSRAARWKAASAARSSSSVSDPKCFSHWLTAAARVSLRRRARAASASHAETVCDLRSAEALIAPRWGRGTGGVGSVIAWGRSRMPPALAEGQRARG
jgi:hypothetical protein